MVEDTITNRVMMVVVVVMGIIRITFMITFMIIIAILIINPTIILRIRAMMILHSVVKHSHQHMHTVRMLL